MWQPLGIVQPVQVPQEPSTNSSDEEGDLLLTASQIEELTLDLVAVRSVNGTPGEAAVVDLIASRLEGMRTARRDLRLHLIRSAHDPLARPTLVAHSPGTGPTGVLLMGHIDTVGTEDYLELEELATRPRELTARAAQGALGEEMATAARSGEWLFGRGVLDMKSGVAAALGAFLDLAETQPAGNLLFAATPDEEGASYGVTALNEWLPDYLASEGIALGAVLNTDYTTGRPGDGGAMHAYAGSTGKLLPAVYVQGVPSHAAEPERGLDPNAVVAAITGEVAYSEELCDGSGAETAPPPVTLLQRDAKPFYDVQSARSAGAYYSLFHRQRTPHEQMERFVAQVRRGVENFAARTRGLGLQGVRVLSFEELRAEADGAPIPDVQGLDVREGARRIVAALVEQAFPDQPIVVAYFAAPLIPSVESAPWAAQAVETAIRTEGVDYRLHRHYPYISDLSFLAASPDWDDPGFAANYPLAATGAERQLPPRLQLAPLMLGPYGFGAHQRVERVLRRHAFEVLPRLVHRAARELLSAQPTGKTTGR